MAIFLSKNIAFLRKSRNINQSEIQDRLGFKRNTWSNWENGVSSPDIPTIMLISDFFGVNLSDIIEKDLTADVNLNTKVLAGKNSKNVNLNVNPSVNLKPEKGQKMGESDDQTNVLNDQPVGYKSETRIIEALTIAVKGLERANARLEQELADLEEENRRLKSEIPVIGKGLGSKKARAS